MLKFFRIPFAQSGDKTAVPDTVDVNGFVSYTAGYGFDYQRQKTDPAAKNIERDKMNEIFFDITTALAELQSQGIPDFITSALNGGSAYSYGQYAVVRYSGDIYVSLVGANTATPADLTKWALLPVPSRLQSALNTRATAAGTADAITATFTPAIAALPAAPNTLSLMVRAGAANTIINPTFSPDGLTAKTIVKGANSALAVGDIAGAGHWLHLDFDPTLDKWVLQNPANGVTTMAASVIGATRNAKMLLTAASASGSFTADQVIVASALNGGAVKLASYAQTINLATTGAGGMDTGAAPASGFVSLYAIAKFDGTQSILACSVATSTSSVYAGANMPVGYSLSALIGIWPTNGSGQLVAGMIADPLGRKFQYQTFPTIFTGHAQITSYTTQSISVGVPAAAKFFSTLITGAFTSGGIMCGVSADATGTGAKAIGAYAQSGPVVMPGGAASNNGGAMLIDCPIITPQTTYVVGYQVGGGATIAMYVSDYSW